MGTDDSVERRKNHRGQLDQFAPWNVIVPFQVRGLRALANIFGLIILFVVGCGDRNSANEVILYATQDQHFAEPLLVAFERETGIRVRAVYDSEAVKTVALANRLVAEARNPQCDVWWSNEALRTRQLAARGIFETNSIVEFGSRSRRLVVNTTKPVTSPSSLIELTNPAWRGKVALAYPMFGTTSAHFIMLRRQWGAARWEQWCTALAANKPFLVDGNSTVVKLVGRGEAEIGLTDSDDIAAAQREGWPVAALPLTGPSLFIPNSVAIVRGAPHPEAARQLAAFLASDATIDKLVASSALEGKSPESVERADWAAAAAEVEVATEAMRRIFLR